MTETKSTFSYAMIRQRHPVGGYHMGDVAFLQEQKPSAWHRFWVRVILGWTWRDDTPRYGVGPQMSERAAPTGEKA